MSDLPEAKITARVKQLQNHMQFDYAMAMGLRMEWEDDRRALLAENQRRGQILARLVVWSESVPRDETEMLHVIVADAREALAGDADD